MEKFKDFLYNKNDIIIALLILALAACVIYNRVMAIMNYDAADVEAASSMIPAAKQIIAAAGAGFLG